MKKDFYNGKVSDVFRGTVTYTLILFPAVCLLCAAILLIIGFTYDKIEDSARVLMYIVGILSGVSAVTYPFITIHLIRIYPKHRKITKFFIQEYVFK